jgi:hypothetical protein
VAGLRPAIVLFFIVTFGFAARAATLRTPIFDHHSWRQADTAAIARSFVRERFNPLYPQVDWRGSRPTGYVETGLELQAWLVAGIWRMSGIRVETGRALAAAMYVATALLLYRFVRRRYDEPTALAAAYAHAFAFPLGLFGDRAYLNEPLLILLSAAALVAAQSWLERRHPASLGVLVAATAIVGMVKLPYLVVYAPIAALFVERFGWRGLVRIELVLAVAASVACAGIWYAHANSLYAMTGLSFGLTDKTFDPTLVFSTRFPLRIGRRLVRDIIGPAGLVLLVWGTIAAFRRRRWAEPAGLAGYVVYLVAVARGNYHHDYYQLAVLPIGAVLVGLGVVAAVEEGARRGWPAARRQWLAAALLWILAATTAVRSLSAHSWYEVEAGRLELCRAVAPQLGPADRLLVVNYPSPDVMFCVDRPGWILDWPARATEIERAAREGASIVLVPPSDAGRIGGLLDGATLLATSQELAAYRLTASAP